MSSFTIIIVGAGIAGLCTAIGLSRHGHKVIVLERAHKLSPVGAGIHVPPNATLVLERWGVLDRFRDVASVPAGFTFRRYENGEVLARTEGEGRNEKMRTPYWSMKRADYQQVLYDLAIELGCEFHLGQQIVTIDEDKPSVRTDTGEVFTGDLIIAADGIKSHLRDLVLPTEDVSPILQPLTTYRAWAPLSDLTTDPSLQSLFTSPTANVWLGPSRHIITYPAANNTILAINGTYPARASAAAAWSQPASLASIKTQFSAFEPRVHAILAAARDAQAWALAEVPRLPRWTSASGKVVLIGDAAHGMLQFLAQGAAMATEDAGALVECLRRVEHVEDLPRAMGVYERARKWRCERVQAGARRNGEWVMMPDGEEQEARDGKMRGGDEFGAEEVDVGPLLDEKFREWLYGHDVFEHTNKLLDERFSGKLSLI